jgi:hypothetical protein
VLEENNQSHLKKGDGNERWNGLNTHTHRKWRKFFISRVEADKISSPDLRNKTFHSRTTPRRVSSLYTAFDQEQVLRSQTELKQRERDAGSWISPCYGIQGCNLGTLPWNLVTPRKDHTRTEELK